MEEQNRKDPGGLKRHGDPMGGASGAERAGGPIGRPGEGESRGNRPGEGPMRSSPGQGGTGASTTGGTGGTSASQRPGMGATGSSGGSSIGQGGNWGGQQGSEGSRFGESLGGGTAVADRLRTDVERVAETGMHRLAEEIRCLGEVSHSAVDKLKEDEHGQVIAKYVDDVARRVEGIADYLEHKGMDGMVRDASDLARRNPAVFLGAAAVVGFIIGRVISASSNRSGSHGRFGNIGSGHQEKSLFEQAETERRPL